MQYEKTEFQEEYKNIPSFLESLKVCGKNKTFLKYLPAEMAMCFVIGIQMTIIPLYGKFVLGIGEGETIYMALMLALDFITSVIFMNVLWKPIVQRIGSKKTWLISATVWIITLIPFFYKLSTVAVFLTIGFVFTNAGWIVYEPENVTPGVILRLKFLMFLFPTLALLISLLFIYFYPLHGERLEKIKAELKKIHEKKKTKI
ncbi:MAG: MFS transporter [Promethearchaeota archaeon]